MSSQPRMSIVPALAYFQGSWRNKTKAAMSQRESSGSGQQQGFIHAHNLRRHSVRADTFQAGWACGPGLCSLPHRSFRVGQLCRPPRHLGQKFAFEAQPLLPAVSRARQFVPLRCALQGVGDGNSAADLAPRRRTLCLPTRHELFVRSAFLVDSHDCSRASPTGWTDTGLANLDLFPLPIIVSGNYNRELLCDGGLDEPIAGADIRHYFHPVTRPFFQIHQHSLTALNYCATNTYTVTTV